MFRLAVSVLVLAMISACERWEVPEESYASREEVVRRDAIDRGWIPTWIPESAREIHEVHNIDTNVSQLAFAYGEFDIDHLSPSCAPAAPTNVVFPRHSMAPWWPGELRQPSSKLERFSFFACREEHGLPHAYVAVDTKDSKVYFWRESAS
jgi:hypothetical protein